MDNLMAELASGFRLRPTPKAAAVAPPNGGQGMNYRHYEVCSKVCAPTMKEQRYKSH